MPFLALMMQNANKGRRMKSNLLCASERSDLRWMRIVRKLAANELENSAILVKTSKYSFGNRFCYVWKSELWAVELIKIQHVAFADSIFTFFSSRNTRRIPEFDFSCERKILLWILFTSFFTFKKMFDARSRRVNTKFGKYQIFLRRSCQQIYKLNANWIYERTELAEHENFRHP